MPEVLTPTAPPATPSALTDDALYEVVDGQIVETPWMGAYQTWFASWLMRFMMASEAVTSRGQVIVEALFLMDRSRPLKRRPDLAFISFDRWPRRRPVPDEEAWDVVPDLAIEIISKSNTAIDVLAKTHDYLRAGVRQVWVIYPLQQTVYVYRSSTDLTVLDQPAHVLDGGDVLPGFHVSLQDLFDDWVGPTEAQPEPSAT
jgi:Uma2 family endonuclease